VRRDRLDMPIPHAVDAGSAAAARRSAGKNRDCTHPGAGTAIAIAVNRGLKASATEEDAMQDHHDHSKLDGALARREVLTLLGATASGAMLGTFLRAPLGRRAGRGMFGPAMAAAADPSCVVRPEMTEGPYFVDERLNRSDIRSDPSDGSVRPGALLALTFAVSRLDGSSCTPFEGAVVDVWHCDAGGIYSDVQDTGFDTVGEKFLRGYQVTDSTGVASFVAIYPGWYQGRTVHVHFKIRTDPDSTTGLEFTSQLFFDDSLTDTVYAQQPYAAKGERTLRNADDGIYQGGGEQMLLSVSDDGAGGYAATFAIALEVTGTTTTTTTGAGGTTTTLGTSACGTVAACLTELESALPDPASASSRAARRTAAALRRKVVRASALLDRAAASGGARRTKLRAKARTKLESVLTTSQAAALKGTLGVALGPITAAVESLLDLL
jgi:protocatechuate 3,4-dioxygenase beta subunit